MRRLLRLARNERLRGYLFDEVVGESRLRGHVADIAIGYDLRFVTRLLAALSYVPEVAHFPSGWARSLMRWGWPRLGPAERLRLAFDVLFRPQRTYETGVVEWPPAAVMGAVIEDLFEVRRFLGH